MAQADAERVQAVSAAQGEARAEYDRLAQQKESEFERRLASKTASLEENHAASLERQAGAWNEERSEMAGAHKRDVAAREEQAKHTAEVTAARLERAEQAAVEAAERSVAMAQVEQQEAVASMESRMAENMATELRKREEEAGIRVKEAAEHARAEVQRVQGAAAEAQKLAVADAIARLQPSSDTAAGPPAPWTTVNVARPSISSPS